jgi:hypothetical protein
MTPGLRKAHRFIWLALAVLLPLLLVASMAVLPRSGPDIMPRMGDEVKMNLMLIGESNGVLVWQGLSLTGVAQLGIEIKSTEISAISLVYLTGTDYQDLLIGKLNHAGLSLFEITGDMDLSSDTVRIVDAIKRDLLSEIPLQIN